MLYPKTKALKMPQSALFIQKSPENPPRGKYTKRPNHRETVVLGSFRGVITSKRSIKIEGLTGVPPMRPLDCSSVPVLLPTSSVGLSVMQVLVVAYILLHFAHNKPRIIASFIS